MYHNKQYLKNKKYTYINSLHIMICAQLGLWENYNNDSVRYTYYNSLSFVPQVQRSHFLDLYLALLHDFCYWLHAKQLQYFSIYYYHSEGQRISIIISRLSIYPWLFRILCYSWTASVVSMIMFHHYYFLFLLQHHVKTGCSYDISLFIYHVQGHGIHITVVTVLILLMMIKTIMGFCRVTGKY